MKWPIAQFTCITHIIDRLHTLTLCITAVKRNMMLRYISRSRFCCSRHWTVHGDSAHLWFQFCNNARQLVMPLAVCNGSLDLDVNLVLIYTRTRLPRPEMNNVRFAVLRSKRTSKLKYYVEKINMRREFNPKTNYLQ